MLFIILKYRCNADTSSPLMFIPANSARNNGLLCASARNSSAFFDPYTVPRYSFTSLNSLLNCWPVLLLGLAMSALVTAWLISCINVCVLIPASWSKDIVFVLGSNSPATERPSSAFKFLVVTSFVVPTTPAKAVASCLTCLLGVIFARFNSASPKSPSAMASVTVTSNGKSSPTTASASKALSIIRLFFAFTPALSVTRLSSLFLPLLSSASIYPESILSANMSDEATRGAFIASIEASTSLVITCLLPLFASASSICPSSHLLPCGPKFTRAHAIARSAGEGCSFVLVPDMSFRRAAARFAVGSSVLSLRVWAVASIWSITASRSPSAGLGYLPRYAIIGASSFLPLSDLDAPLTSLSTTLLFSCSENGLLLTVLSEAR